MQKKTSKNVKIPVSGEALFLLRELIAGKIHSISNQKLNTYIKKICEIAGINESREVFEYKSGVRTCKVVAKWSLIGCHTLRRTFSTRLLNGGLNVKDTMQLTGHQDINSFYRYINSDADEKLQKAREILSDDKTLMAVSK